MSEQADPDVRESNIFLTLQFWAGYVDYSGGILKRYENLSSEEQYSSIMALAKRGHIELDPSQGVKRITEAGKAALIPLQRILPSKA